MTGLQCQTGVFLKVRGVCGWALQKWLNICVVPEKQGARSKNVTVPEILGHFDWLLFKRR
jgi:hypothetical protein